jgi:TPR repeat protein
VNKTILKSVLFALSVIAFLALVLAAAFVKQVTAPLPSADEIASLQMAATRDAVAENRLRLAAGAGMPEAQLALGRLLIWRTRTVEREEGRAWLGLVAGNAGHATVATAAQTELGKSYFRGVGSDGPDYRRAFNSLDAAAQQGDAVAAYYLALMYKNGLGVPANKILAARWMLKSAQQNIPAAMFIVANMYLSGDGLPRDERETRQWIEKAAEMEHPEASQLMAIGLREGSMGFRRNEKLAEMQMREAAHALTHRALDP